MIGELINFQELIIFVVHFGELINKPIIIDHKRLKPLLLTQHPHAILG